MHPSVVNTVLFNQQLMPSSFLHNNGNEKNTYRMNVCMMAIGVKQVRAVLKPCRTNQASLFLMSIFSFPSLVSLFIYLSLSGMKTLPHLLAQGGQVPRKLERASWPAGKIWWRPPCTAGKRKRSREREDYFPFLHGSASLPLLSLYISPVLMQLVL